MTSTRSRAISPPAAATTTAMVQAVLLFVCTPALADDGHNHGGEPPAAAGPALPRFAAESDLFELVGVVDGTRLTLYLDRFADNSPVEGAKLELEVGGEKLLAQPHAEGEYEATLAKPLAAGVVSVTATVTTGSENDLLAADLDIHEEAHADEHAGEGAAGWQRIAAWAGGGLLLLAVLVGLARRVGASRRLRTGVAA